MSVGFIKLHRKLTQWEWYSDINTTRLFMHLLIMSNYEPKKWRGIQIDRGEYLTSTLKLPEETGLTRQQIRTSLNKLKSTNEITIKTTSKYSIVKLENYCLYQGKEVVEQPTKQPSKKPTGNHQVTTTKEVKEIEEDKNINKEAFEEIYKSFSPEKNFKVIPYDKNRTRFDNCVKQLGGVNQLRNQINDYKAYLAIATWRKRKAFSAWINDPSDYANDWVADMEQENNKTNFQPQNNKKSRLAWKN